MLQGKRWLGRRLPNPLNLLPLGRYWTLHLCHRLGYFPGYASKLTHNSNILFFRSKKLSSAEKNSDMTKTMLENHVKQWKLKKTKRKRPPRNSCLFPKTVEKCSNTWKSSKVTSNTVPKFSSTKNTPNLLFSAPSSPSFSPVPSINPGPPTKLETTLPSP